MSDMKERLRKRVTELTDIIGVSGYEWDVAMGCSHNEECVIM